MMTPEHGEAGAALQCTHKVCFHFSSICSCCEKITERLMALNIPNSWHARETMSDETIFRLPKSVSILLTASMQTSPCNRTSFCRDVASHSDGLFAPAVQVENRLILTSFY